MRKRCRHENADHLKPGDTFALQRADSPLWPVLAECFRCIDCAAWLSLGESTDTPATAIELAGARIAAEWADENYTPGYDRFEYCPTTKTDELCGRCEGLYLAHAIATHKDGTP